MRKLYGRWKRWHLCEYWTRRQYNLDRYRDRKHYGKKEMTQFKIMKDGVYKYTLHNTPILYMHRYQLRQHLFFVHRADDDEMLITHNLDPQGVEMLCKDCKGKSYEYGLTRDDYYSFCSKHDKTEELFNKFLEFNRY